MISNHLPTTTTTDQTTERATRFSLSLRVQVHLGECQGNSDSEIVLKPHITRDSTDSYYKTALYEQPSNVTGGVVPWEDVLKHTTYLTLSEK